jgi:hypothetical protein
MEQGPLGASPFQAAAVEHASLQQKLEPLVPLQSTAWDYIIVYESGDLAGSAASLADGQLKGVLPGTSNATRSKAKFHFVVDAAGSRPGASEGELEVGSAWLNQETGTPHKGWPNPSYHSFPSYSNAIGICVVGDSRQRTLGDAQSRSLVDLTRFLQQQLGIPKDKVLFQWELAPHAASVSQAQKEFAAKVRMALD